MNRLISLILPLSLLILLSLVHVSTALAQDKGPLTYEDFDQWRSISGQTLTPDGRYLIYGLNPQEGDGGIRVQNLRNNSEVSLARGERFEVSYDGRTLVHFIAAPYDSVRKALINDKKPGEIFDDTLAIYSIYDDVLETFPEVGSFKLPERSGQWLAYLYDRESEEESEKSDDESEPETTEEESSAAVSDTTATEPENLKTS